MLRQWPPVLVKKNYNGIYAKGTVDGTRKCALPIFKFLLVRGFSFYEIGLCVRCVSRGCAGLMVKK